MRPSRDLLADEVLDAVYGWLRRRSFPDAAAVWAFRRS